MPSIIQRSFAGGEVAPAVYGRADQTKYQTGLRTCRNFFVRRHGGVSNRPGSQFITEQKVSSARGRLLKFVFNAQQTYVLLFENLTMRIVKNGALLNVAGVTAWSAVTAYVLGNLVVQGGVNYYCILAHTNHVPPNATYWYALSGTIYEIPTPYVTADLQALQISQSADVVTITHQNYGIYNLKRTGDTAWTLTLSVQAPSIAAPTITNNGAAGAVTSWVVTTIKAETFEESNPSAPTSTSAVPSSGSPVTITITGVPGAQEYNVYKALNGVYGFIGVADAVGLTFVDTGIVPNMTLTAPLVRDPFVGASNFPAVSGYYQQRKYYGSTLTNVEGVWASKTGFFNNFSESIPLQDDDAVTFTISGQQVNAVRALVEVGGSFIVLTDAGAWVLEGDVNGAIIPSSPNPRRRGNHGSSTVAPVIVGNAVIFIQSRGSFIRDLRFESTFIRDPGRDLSVFSPHLVEGYTLEHMDYAMIPHSIIWIQRSDGQLLGLTYMPEQEVWGWHRHDTMGLYEDVCVVPEGQEDAVYVLVNRTIQGVTRRYVERFSSRRVTDVTVDAHFLDAYLTYDGRNVGATTMLLSGGTLWDVTETLTLTASAGYFVAGDVGKSIVLTIGTDMVTLQIKTYTNGTTVSGTVNKTVPASLRGVATAVWSKAVTAVAGLDHLEGQAVGILADGDVLTNGQDSPLTTVVGGSVSLGGAYSVVHVGLPYTADFELLDLEVLGGETLSDKKKLVTSVTLFVEASRGIFAGIDAAHLFEFKQRTTTIFASAMPVATNKVEISMGSTWNNTGRVFCRQRDPLPLSILQAIPNGTVGG